MKTANLILIVIAVAVVSFVIGRNQGRNQRPKINLTITVTGDIVDSEGNGIFTGITAAIDDVEILALGPQK